MTSVTRTVESEDRGAAGPMLPVWTFFAGPLGIRIDRLVLLASTLVAVVMLVALLKRTLMKVVL